MQGVVHSSEVLSLSTFPTRFTVPGLAPDDNLSEAGRAWLAMQGGSHCQSFSIDFACWCVFRNQVQSLLKEGVATGQGANLN